MSLSMDPRSVNASTGVYLMRSFNVDPPEKRLMPGYPSLRNYGDRLKIGIDCDEVYPGIVIGDGLTAKNMDYLNKIGITHVLNTAENDVNLSPSKFAKQGIRYKGFRCMDVPHADIAQYFDECAEFIDLALSFSQTKVFVACLLGFSRSTAIVAAYLMKKKGFTATQAITEMRTIREVKPNVGFLQQLGQLDDKIRREKYRYRR
uniref:Dual specificity protein phosphatase n=2 Tax=Caligus rogercresseyi TaxID=217165 RepID=C1BQB7_CALRO|nr:Dual specificity protein phosphatase 3 [Caligus rogercresseyi]|eukprot:TRINITY_DN14972_c0_g1_i1.p1 TRINITY_DN14972_c0_g1~~TRINITY_DN14972_c0_g1_i1.p1  ORF type:complete len:204 (-),score=41.63 TRINITY_DN14972_c0_g1_i1:123-734(-)